MEDKMNLLDRLTEPTFAKDHAIRPSARALGAALVVLVVVSLGGFAAAITWMFAVWFGYRG